MPTETETETETEPLTLSDGRLARLREAKGRDLIAATRLTDDTNALAAWAGAIAPELKARPRSARAPASRWRPRIASLLPMY